VPQYFLAEEDPGVFIRRLDGRIDRGHLVMVSSRSNRDRRDDDNGCLNTKHIFFLNEQT
jgi:hypothetical protein